ncbi:putative Endonuclease/exonuclease/phosphatase superfamily [Helianthus debilis subsp. tardiflorus]
MADFNNFISSAGLVEVKMGGGGGGRKFTWMSDDGRKMSKLDRVLVRNNFFNLWPYASATTLPRRYSDHCPILCCGKEVNWGPIPFKFFNSWISCQGIEEAVENSWQNVITFGTKELSLMRKLKALNEGIKKWRKSGKSKEDVDRDILVGVVDELETKAELVGLTEEDLVDWVNSKALLKILDSRRRADLVQMAKVRWDIEGDENIAFSTPTLITKRTRLEFTVYL